MVFTDPQVATVGLNERAAREAGIAAEAPILALDNVPPALANFDTEGFIKLVAEKSTGRLLIDRNAVSCGEVEKLARVHLRSVREKITDLKRMERVLGETVRSCSGEDVPDCPLIDTLFGVRR